MKTILLLILFSSSVFALTGNHLLTKPNPEYMAFFLKSYLPWHEKKFANHLLAAPERLRIQKVLSGLNHWKVPGHPMLDQFLIGQAFVKGKAIFRYRLYVDQTLRQKGEWFIEWDEVGEFCTLTPLLYSEIKMKSVPQLTDGIYFNRECKKAPASVVLGTSVNSKTYFNLFPESTYYELRTYTDDQLTSILYTSQDVLIDALPREYYPRIVAHGAEALLPLDKFEFSRKGETWVYYP